ncbi:MAG: DUF4417 domain-containing protein [Firmicutes bacterium]|nr:DUF4417 domain-containing protein [Bacillota bacterium]
MSVKIAKIKNNKKQSANTKDFKWYLTKGCNSLVGNYDMPQLKPIVDANISNLVPFHEANVCKNPADSWFHFYIYDYLFERIWRNPNRYLPILQRFNGGISTDFSMYIDMPKSQQIWNCWRNRVMAYWMQSNGLNVIPNACWGDMESLDWAFDGLPEHSILSITTQGCLKKTDECKFTLVNGLHSLVRKKKPTKIIVYGKFPEEWKKHFPMPIVTMKAFSEEKWGDR